MPLFLKTGTLRLLPSIALRRIETFAMCTTVVDSILQLLDNSFGRVGASCSRADRRKILSRKLFVHIHTLMHKLFVDHECAAPHSRPRPLIIGTRLSPSDCTTCPVNNHSWKELSSFRRPVPDYLQATANYSPGLPYECN